MHWIAAARTDRGRIRPSNEDAFSLREEAGFFALADGMGGHAAGEVASEMAVAGVTEEYVSSHALSPAEAETVLMAAVQKANRAIFERSGREADKLGMGTTLTTLALLEADRAYCIAHVGDSRAYRLRDEKLVQLTTDHTWVQQEVQLGRLSPNLARRHPFASVLTRALGVKDEVDVDLVRGELQPGDVFLLCSDGLTGMLGDGDLAGILTAADPEAAAGALVVAANAAGGSDNITAIVVSIEQ